MQGNTVSEHRVIARLMSGNALPAVHVPSTFTVQDLKLALAAQAPDFPARQQRLTFGGRELLDKQTLGEIGLPEDTTVDLIMEAVHCEHLVQSLLDRDPLVRMRAAGALGALGLDAAPSASELLVFLGDENNGVRCEVAKALGCMGPDAASLAASFLEKEDWRLRWGAARALEVASQRRSGDAALHADAIARRLLDPWPSIRPVAARALGNIGPAAQQHVPALRSAVWQGDDDLREAATEALGQIYLGRAKDFATGLVSWITG
mmetsp:Transcript_65459/g.211046  ORF Transcript_65459/g.211046 Transcript_65459/m.211046 type:complete len:263 (-) Transcript_65459:89-877(-)